MKKFVLSIGAVLTVICTSFTQNISVRYQICNNCSSQENGDDPNTTYTYDEIIRPYLSEDVTSDFGARHLGGYDWHKGVDYKPLQYEVV